MTVVTADGKALAVQVHEARGVRRATVLALHAMMVDARSLDRPPGAGLASTLADAGLEVWRADLRGHGGSGPAPGEGGSWSYDDLVRSDLPALVAAARDRGGPLVVVGHSLGGHAAAAAATERVPIDGLVLLAANVWLPSHERSRRRRLAKHVAMRAFRASVRPLGYFPARRLRAGPADEAGPYVRDLCRFWFEDRWASGDGADWWAGLRGYRGRVLAVAGRGDRLYAHPVAMREFCGGFSSDRLTFQVAERGDGGLGWDPTHVGLACDARSRPLWERIADWISRLADR